MKKIIIFAPILVAGIGSLIVGPGAIVFGIVVLVSLFFLRIAFGKNPDAKDISMLVSTWGAFGFATALLFQKFSEKMAATGHHLVDGGGGAAGMAVICGALYMASFMILVVNLAVKGFRLIWKRIASSR